MYYNSGDIFSITEDTIEKIEEAEKSLKWYNIIKKRKLKKLKRKLANSILESIKCLHINTDTLKSFFDFIIYCNTNYFNNTFEYKKTENEEILSINIPWNLYGVHFNGEDGFSIIINNRKNCFYIKFNYRYVFYNRTYKDGYIRVPFDNNIDRNLTFAILHLMGMCMISRLYKDEIDVKLMFEMDVAANI